MLKAVSFCETGKVVSKVVWSKELSELKKASLEAHRLWVCAGRLCSGQINCDRIAAKAQYKRAIRVSRDSFERNCNERLLNSLLVHDYQSFWREWKKTLWFS